METSPSRCDSAFRGGWPRCKPRSSAPSFERFDVDAAAFVESFSSSTASFIDMDDTEELFSMRWTLKEDGLFHFSLPRAEACSPLLATDAGASYADALSACSSPAFHTAQSTPASATSSSRRPGAAAAKPLLATRRILLRYLRFLVPLCRKARALRLPVPVPGRVFSAPRSRTTPARRSTSSASSAAAEHWCHGHADVAVRDAILHCKKSLLTARTEC